MIKVVHTHNDHENTRRIIHSMNFSEVDLPFPVGPPQGVVVDTALSDLGGLSVNRADYRHRFPDNRWFVEAVGLVNPEDSAGVTIGLAYVKNDGTTVSLGTITLTGAGPVKTTIGKFDLFASPGVPNTENIVIVRLTAQKITSGFALLSNWTIWLRLIASKQ